MTDGDLEFEKIHHTFRPKILRYLTRLVGEGEAEDLAQEVFVKVNQGLQTLRGKAQVSTWIYRIATNAALDRLRSPSLQRTPRKGHRVVSVPEEEITRQDKDAWTGERPPSVETSLIREEMNECIRNFVENLPANNRTVMVLSELEGLKDSEIAEIVGVSLKAVKIRLHRARAMLRKELEAHGSFYRDERGELVCDLKSAYGEFETGN